MTRIILGIGVLTLGAAVAAQVKEERPALGTIAKAAQEEKAKGKPESKAPVKPEDAAPAAKKYTNDDLGRSRSRPTPVYPTPPSATSYSPDRPKDEAYWRSRAAPILKAREDTASLLSVVKARLEAIKGNGLDVAVANGQSSPIQAERRQLGYQVADLEAQMRRVEQMMATLEDEGRRGGALPGWFR